MAGLRYDHISRFKITACCDGPLRIGSSIGGKEEVLIDPLTNTPFVQASSIAGVFRGYCKDILKDERWEELFGSNSVENMSRVRFEDGHFTDGCKLEYRPHVSINNALGSVSSKTIKGTDSKSGQKYNMEYIGTGAEISFDLYLYEEKSSGEDLSELLMEIISAMRSGMIRFGGKKSNGSGELRLTAIKKKEYNMFDETDRKAWIRLDDDDLSDCFDCLRDVDNKNCAYEISISGSVENYIQVKGLAVTGVGSSAPDSQNMKNCIGEYIVPGSSFKGAVRAQMEKISEYLGCGNVVYDAFGTTAEKGLTEAPGNLVFSDTAIGDAASNDNMHLEYRIHIDKFTGGVMNGSLFNEKNAAGDMCFDIKILNRNNPKKTLGLLIFAIRDLAIGLMSIGNGHSVGKGIINVSRIAVKDVFEGCSATITYDNGQGNTEDPSGIIKSAICELKGECV